MKKLSLLIFFICFFLTGCTSPENEPVDELSAIKEKDKITIGIKPDSKPFCFKENGQYKGFDVDVAKNVAAVIFEDEPESHINFVELKPQERLMALNDKKVDIVVATFSINDKRRKVVDFTEPYYIAGQTLMVKANSKISSIRHLNNKPVAVVMGTTGEKTLRILAPNAVAIGAKSYTEALERLKNDETEAILADDSLLYGLLEDNASLYKILPVKYTKEYYAIGLRQGEASKPFKDYLNAIIEDMQKSGELKELKKKWLPKM